MVNPTVKVSEVDLESLTYMDELPKIWGRPWVRSRKWAACGW